MRGTVKASRRTLRAISAAAAEARAAVVATGGLLLAAGAAHGAPVGANLVVNGGFENVNLASTGYYNGPQILDWAGVAAFAYSHDESSSVAGTVPNFADGAAPSGAGHWYFTAANANPEIRSSGQFAQTIDVSGGATGASIAAGQARFALSAYMSSYADESDVGSVLAEFLAPGGAGLGSALITDGDGGPDNVWSLESATGLVPVGTANVRISVFGTAVAGAFDTADGYIDNVDFRIDSVPEPSTIGLFVAGSWVRGLAGRRRRDSA